MGHHGIQIQFRRRRVTVGTIITLADFGKLDALTHKVTIETASASQVFRFAIQHGSNKRHAGVYLVRCIQYAHCHHRCKHITRQGANQSRDAPGFADHVDIGQQIVAGVACRAVSRILRPAIPVHTDRNIHSQVLAVIPAGGILPVPKKRIIFRADLLRINNRFGDRQKLSQSILVHTFAFDSKDRRAGRRV